MSLFLDRFTMSIDDVDQSRGPGLLTSQLMTDVHVVLHH